MSEPATGITPGVDRILTFHVRGGEFRLRRPTRSDQAEINRRYVAKLMRACPPLGDYVTQDVAKEALSGLDGGNLFSEARLEVLLLPRKAAADLGERAPTHWLRELRDPDQHVIGRIVVFDEVDPAEFDEVARHVDQALAPEKKSDSPTVGSTDSAAGQTNG